MLDPALIPLAQSALLIIDVQDSFLLSPRWQQRSNPAFEENLTLLLALYRKHNLPVFFILHHDDDPGFRPSDPAVKLMDFLNHQPNEVVLHKFTRNAFTSTHLQPLLLARGIRRLLITGIQTEQCCETTTRVAADLGFAVDFLTDATRTFPIPDPSHPEHILATDAIIERTEFVLRNRFARIRSTREIASELL